MLLPFGDVVKSICGSGQGFMTTLSPPLSRVSVVNTSRKARIRVLEGFTIATLIQVVI